MIKISSDNPDIEKDIIVLCDLVERSGGYVSSDLEFVDVNGNTSVFAGADCNDDYIFKLRHEFLIPYDNFDFDVESDDIVIVHDDQNESQEHLSTLETMISLYNRSGKFKSHLKEHPLLSFSEYPDLIQYMLKAREGKDLDIVRGILAEPEYFDELALLTFFKSRLLHCRLYSKKADHKAVLIPVAEFMNHHPLGAGFDNLYGKEACFMATGLSMPVSDSREVFTSYGRFDALDTFIHYGFVDQSSRYMRSIPLKIDLDDMGTIVVRGFSAVVPVSQIPDELQDLAFYFPQINHDDGSDLVELSHIYIPQDRARFSMRRVLEYAIHILRPNIDEVACKALIGEAEKQILNLNEDYYNQMKLLAVKDKGNAVMSRNFLLLSEMQIKKVVNYRSLVSAL